MRKLQLILLAAVAIPRLVRADEAPALELIYAVGETALEVPPSHAAEAMPALASNTLPEASLGAADKLSAMRAWNAAGHLPTQNGFTRSLETPLRAEFLASRSGRSSTEAFVVNSTAMGAVWSARLKVMGAYRVRLHLVNVSAPAGTVFTIWSAVTTPRSFGLELRGPAGDIWTPSVGGEDIFLEARSAAAKGGFEIRELAELMPPAPEAFSCLLDATCITAGAYAPIASVRKAIAQLQFIVNGGAFVCTGGLLNDTDNNTTIPYLLTANHCISTQTVAATVEATWDYKTGTCGGPPPNINALPRSSGATLLATSVESDFCFLRLNSIPAGRFLLSWVSTILPGGLTLSRVSHPQPESTILPQSFSQTLFTSSPDPDRICHTDSDGRPFGDLTKFRYSTKLSGGVFGGSSGSPLLNPAGQVVGQLSGTCGQQDGCSSSVYTVDGSFKATYPWISRYLNPSTAGGPCFPSATTACLAGGRFEVQVDWRDSTTTGNGQVMSFGGQRAENNDSAFYWFFSATNFELGIKVLDACTPTFGNKYWVFISGLTNQGWTVHVRDTQTDATKTYSNALNHLTSTTADTAAFDCQ